METVENGSMDDRTHMKWEFKDKTWKNSNFVYDLLPQIFSKNTRGPTFDFHTFPTFIVLFELFCTPAIMSAIVVESNLYITSRDALGKTKGGAHWKEFTVPSLQAFMVMAIYVGMKKQPYYRTYRMKNSFFYYPKIASIFSRQNLWT